MSILVPDPGVDGGVASEEASYVGAVTSARAAQPAGVMVVMVVAGEGEEFILVLLPWR